MSVTLIFDEHISGHHLEYLHHYYRGALARPDEKFIFCVENGFLKEKDKYEWPDADNISFHLMPSSEIDYARNAQGWRHGWRMSKLLAQKSKELKADRVILTNFMFLIPFLLFVMPKGIKVRGIIYRIYLYTKSQKSKLRYLIDEFCHWLMARSGVMEKFFILNDQESADEMNRMFHTGKFTFLPDPVPEVDKSKLRNLRSELGIPEQNKVFFHFGGLTQRKGTLEILKAINLSTTEELGDRTFVFAGRIYQEMHDEFYMLLEKSKQKVQILVFDEFCSYQFLYNMCYTCDVVLMPYQQSELSSGILGYAAVFEKPVIGPSTGLIGNAILNYRLGETLQDVKADSIRKSFSQTPECESELYARRNQVSEFINTIYG